MSERIACIAAVLASVGALIYPSTAADSGSSGRKRDAHELMSRLGQHIYMHANPLHVKCGVEPCFQLKTDDGVLEIQFLVTSKLNQQTQP